MAFEFSIQIEQINTVDGYVLDNTEVEKFVQAMAAFTEQNGVTWEQAIDEKSDEAQNILMQFWVDPTL